jgi:colanic acid/amylovoran biosynthesis glycosyltransferase
MTPPDLPRVIIYRDQLLPFSETFILNQADSLQVYAPIFVGRKRVSGVDLADRDVELVSNGGQSGRIREALYLCGLPPKQLATNLAGLSPKLLHAHFGLDALNALPLQSSLDIPLIVTFHGYDATQRATFRNDFWMWRYGRRRPLLAKRATRILAVSDHIRACLIGLGFPEDLIRTHYIGVDIKNFSPTPLSERKPVVLGVGRFVEKKGFEFLIDAMAEVQQKSPDSELVIIGSGALGDDLRMRASSKLRSFRIFGPCQPEAVREWMKQARVLAVPSVTSRSGDTEGLPMALVEALASGLPVVATDHAGNPEAVSDGTSGFLVPERNASALAARILDLLHDDVCWTTFSTSSREIAERKFDLEAQTRKLETIYGEIS